MSDTEEIIKSMMDKNLDAARDKTRAALYTKATEYMDTKRTELATDFATTDVPDVDAEMSDGTPEIDTNVVIDSDDAHTFVNVDSEETTEPTTETEE